MDRNMAQNQQLEHLGLLLQNIRQLCQNDSATKSDILQILNHPENILPEQRHPLIYPIILQHVFPLLDVHNLKRCRLVCTMWADHGLLVLGNKCRIRLDNPDSYYNDNQLLIKLKDLSEKMEETPGRSATFFRNVTLDYGWLTSEKDYAQEWLQRYGENIRDLELQIHPGHSHSNASSRNIFFLLKDTCPNLKVFKLFASTADCYEDDRDDTKLRNRFCYSVNRHNAKDPPIRDQPAKFRDSLRLKEIHLVGSVVKIFPKFCVDLINCSPELEILHTRFTGSVKSLTNFYEEILKRQGGLERLKQLRWDTSHLKNFNLKFPYGVSSNLEICGIGTVYESGKPLTSYGMGRYLSLCHNATKLILQDKSPVDFDHENEDCRPKNPPDYSSSDEEDYNYNLDRQKEAFWRDVYPFQNLRMLKLKSLPVMMDLNNFRLFPNVFKLEIGCFCNLHSVGSGIARRIRITEVFQHPPPPELRHHNIKIVHIMELLFDDGEMSFGVIDTFLPSLEELFVTVSDSNLLAVLNNLSQTSLRERVKRFGIMIELQDGAQFPVGVMTQFLNTYPGLEVLSIHTPKTWFVKQDIDGLFVSPNLKVVNLGYWRNSLIPLGQPHFPEEDEFRLLRLAKSHNVELTFVQCLSKLCCFPHLQPIPSVKYSSAGNY